MASINQVESSPSTIDQLFSKLPNELLLAILSHLKVQQLIHLRLVCTRWQALIEPMYHSKSSLLLIDNEECHYQELCNQIEKRFFGEIKLSDFACIKLKAVRNPELSQQFETFLGRLFPAVEQLIINNQQCFSLSFVLSLWPLGQLTTLSLDGRILNTDLLVNRINSCSALRRLDLSGPVTENYSQLAPTLNKIEHFSYHSGADEYVLSTLMGFLGSNCTRFSLFDIDLTPEVIQEWYNEPWLSSVTHLKLNIEGDIADVFQYLAQHVTQLQVLYIDSGDINRLTPQILGNLGPLRHLVELNFKDVTINFVEDWKSALDNQNNLVQLTSVQTCILNLFGRLMPDLSETDKSELNRVLSAILPNVQNLQINYE